MSRLNHAEPTPSEVLAVLERSAQVHAVQRTILVLYALLGGIDRAVKEQAYVLADRIGMTPAGFSRARRDLVAGGWLEEVDKIANIPYYRLADKATGRQTVVQLRA
ncbi:MAG TPA: hypothetical protein VIM84_03690 [Gemmatimonadales bacterium]